MLNKIGLGYGKKTINTPKYIAIEEVKTKDNKVNVL